jgi:DNA polymerase III gamma/tau subunit
MENLKLQKVICGYISEVAEREKKKAINTDDYGTALVAAIVEGIFRDAESSLD